MFMVVIKLITPNNGKNALITAKNAQLPRKLFYK